MFTPIDPSITLARLIDAHPELARALEHRGLDYCCGGQRSLAAACAEVGLDATATAAELAALATSDRPAEWAAMDAAALADHLEATHHAYLWAELPRLSALVAKVAGVHGERHPELHEVSRLYDAVRADLEPHLLKEERVLFPMVRELAGAEHAPSFHCGTVRNPISVMLREHDAVGELLAALRRCTDGYTVPEDGCASYRACYEGLATLEADTHLHIHKENNVLFPMVMEREALLSGR
jgi:regulator of cell morphogenesis and NO signaling